MPSLRLSAVALGCVLSLSACSAAIAPPFNDGPRAPSSSSRPPATIKKSGTKMPRPSKGSGATASAVWGGDCTAAAACSRLERDCPQGTICVFAGVGPEGSCLTLEQRRYCQGQ